MQIQGLRGKDTLEILELELKTAQAKNSELQSTVVMLESKLKESELVKQTVTLCKHGDRRYFFLFCLLGNVDGEKTFGRRASPRNFNIKRIA